MEIPHDRNGALGSVTKDRTLFQKRLADCVRVSGIDLEGKVLIVGGSYQDAEILRGVGFRRMTLSNLQDMTSFEPLEMTGVELNTVNADVEEMSLANDSYDLVLAHEVLHHCRSPHKALLEMLRVSSKHVILLEPNDSLLMQALVGLRLSFPYELPAVVANGFEAGGVRNSCVPNYIYRWSPRDLQQATASFIPELEFDFYIRSYWDFNVDRAELARRGQTRIGSVTKIMGPGLFLAGLHGFQAVANHLPWVREQGNKFFGCITKLDELKPWLVRWGDGIAFNREYGAKG
jgi:SAM-dependent methyltransferase